MPFIHPLDTTPKVLVNTILVSARVSDSALIKDELIWRTSTSLKLGIYPLCSEFPVCFLFLHVRSVERHPLPNQSRFHAHRRRLLLCVKYCISTSLLQFFLHSSSSVFLVLGFMNRLGFRWCRQ